MEIRRSDDVAAWLDAAGPLLVADESRHDLILGLAGTLIRQPSVYAGRHLWTADLGGVVVAAALQPPPHNRVLGRPSEAIAVHTLAMSSAPGDCAPSSPARAPPASDRTNPARWLTWPDQTGMP